MIDARFTSILKGAMIASTQKKEVLPYMHFLASFLHYLLFISRFYHSLYKGFIIKELA